MVKLHAMHLLERPKADLSFKSFISISFFFIFASDTAPRCSSFFFCKGNTSIPRVAFGLSMKKKVRAFLQLMAF